MKRLLLLLAVSLAGWCLVAQETATPANSAPRPLVLAQLTDPQIGFGDGQIVYRETIADSTEGVEAGQVTAAGENYTMPGFEKQEKVIDYDNEKLREENAEEVRRQWED